MSTMNYMDIHCSFRDCSKYGLSGLPGVIGKIVMKFCLCQLFSGCSKESYRFSAMSTLDYVDFHCSVMSFTKKLYKFLFMWTFIAVLALI